MSRAFDALKKSTNGAPAKTNGSATATVDPVIPAGPAHRAPDINLDLSPDLEEKYQRLRGNLLTGPNKDRLKTLLIVGSVPGEGATTTATLLASVLAAGSRSRVLLIDANLRTPSLAELFNLTGDGRGLTDLLIKDSGLDEFVRPTPHHNLFVLCGGRPLRSPAYLFAESGMDRVLSMVRESYDLAILDGAPLRDFSDSTFLAPKVDGTILVVEAEKTSSDTAEASRRQLERSGARMLGAVLNKRRSYMPDWVERFI